MDVKTVLGGKVTRTVVDFTSVVLSGIVLTRVMQIAWSLAGINFIIDGLPLMKYSALLSMIVAILIGFLGAYVVKIFFPRWYWWETIAPAGTVVIGCIVLVVTIDLQTSILLLDLLLGFYFWNLACCDVHLREMLAGRQESSGYPWIAEIVEALLVPTGTILPFMVDPYDEIVIMVVYLAVLSGLSVFMIASAKFSAQGPANQSLVGSSLDSLSLRSRVKTFLDGKNIVRAILLAVYLLLLEYYGFQAIQARQWFYGTPSLVFYYDIELYSITFYGILAGSFVAFLALRLAFEQEKFRTASIETALAITFLGPVTFLLFLVIGDALELGMLFMFCQAAFVGMAFALFIALLGHGLQVRIIPRNERPLP